MKDRDTLLLQEAYAAINTQHQLNESFFDTVANAIEYLQSGAGAALLVAFRKQIHSILRKVGVPLKANKQELISLKNKVDQELSLLQNNQRANTLDTFKLYDEVIEKLKYNLQPTTTAALRTQSRTPGIRTHADVTQLGKAIKGVIYSLISNMPDSKSLPKTKAVLMMVLLSIAIKQILDLFH